MKRIIAFTIVLLMACSIFAVSSWSSTQPDTSTGTGNTPLQYVELVINDSIYSYNVGFSTNGDKTNGESLKTSMKLSDDKTVAEGASDLYVWWDIFTANKFNVSIKTSGALTQQNVVDGQPATIGFTVDGEIQAGEIKSVEDGVISTAIDITSEGTDEMTFLSAGDSTTAQNFKGSQKLTIKTTENALRNKPEAEYLATLTITVSDGQ